MALEYRRRGRKNLGQEGQSRLDDSPRGGGRPRPSQGIVDSNPSSTYFNITDIPSYLGTGKNTIRLLGSSLLRKNVTPKTINPNIVIIFPYAHDVIPKSLGLEPIKPDSFNTGANRKIIITERIGDTIKVHFFFENNDNNTNTGTAKIWGLDSTSKKSTPVPILNPLMLGLIFSPIIEPIELINSAGCPMLIQGKKNPMIINILET